MNANNASDAPNTGPPITGVILAGGKARRMGGRDKGLITLAGRPMVEYVIQALRPQVECLLINANRNLEDYRAYGLAVVEDPPVGAGGEGYHGPLAGMAAALAVARTDYVLSVPCDSPFLPADLAGRLFAALQGQGEAELAVAHDGERLQPVFTLLARTLAPSLNAFLAAGGRKIDRWYEGHRMALADLSDCTEAFINVNTPDQRDALEARLQGRPA